MFLFLHILVLLYCFNELLKLRKKRIIDKAVREFDLSKLAKEMDINGVKTQVVDCTKLTEEQQKIMMKHASARVEQMQRAERELERNDD
jgi:hypothetical protein